MKGKIKNFTDLIAWQEGHKLVLAVYKITKKFPKQATYILTDQMCRSAGSITANIAEGFPKKTSKDKIRFYNISQGSLCELQNHLLVARDIDYISEEEFNMFWEQTTTVQKLINGLIKNLKTSHT